MLAAPGSQFRLSLPGGVAAFNSYIGAVESRLALQHRLGRPSSPCGAVQQSDIACAGESSSSSSARLLADRFCPEPCCTTGAATAFVAGATADDFARLLKNFDAYPTDFSPQVLQARVLTHEGDHLQAWMRVRQHHVITVVMDTTYDVTFGRLDAQHGYSISRSTQISEIDSAWPRASMPAEDHGFLWRQNTYWSYEERDGGLYIQIESVSLTRSIPTGLGWVVGPFIESVPRQSLEFTLRSACNALHGMIDQQAKEFAHQETAERERTQG